MKQEINLIIIGAAIGFISSIGTTIVTDFMKRQGKIKIFYKVVFSKFLDKRTWGFRDGSEGMVFDVPLWIEIQNTSNSVRVVRDINISLYMDGKEITQMTQITKCKDEWYGNEGAYSFVVEPRIIKKFGLHFAKCKKEMGENYQFDEIRLRYYDENNKVKTYSLGKIEQCWELGNLERDGVWKLAK